MITCHKYPESMLSSKMFLHMHLPPWSLICRFKRNPLTDSVFSYLHMISCQGFSEPLIVCSIECPSNRHLFSCPMSSVV